MYFFISFCIAIIGSGFQSRLVSTTACQILFGLAVFLLYMAWRYPAGRTVLLVITGFVSGMAYVNMVAAHRLQQQLPEMLEQQDIDLEVVIASLPVSRLRYQQYRADVVKAPDWSMHKVGHQVNLQTLLLNDYQHSALHPCDTWQVTVRLKRPHGLGNPAGFDYEAYLLEQGIQARGYVRQGRLLKASEGFCLHGLRKAWSDYVLQHVPENSAAWIVALSTGDKSLLDDEQNLLLQETGTTHLFVISGSHIALCAWLVYGGLMLLRRMGMGRVLAGDWRPWAAASALAISAVYTALAGYGIPSQRSLVMLVVFLGTQVIGLQPGLWLRYWLSMAAVLLINPLSALNVGFVLSFGAVFILIMLTQSISQHLLLENRRQRFYALLKDFLWAQLVIFIGLLPFTVFYFARISLLAPLANALAIPAMSIVILPTILLALFLWCITGDDYGLLQFAVYQLDVLFGVMANANDVLKELLPTFPLLAFNGVMVTVLLLASLLILLPRAFNTRPLGMVLLLAVFVSDAREPLPAGEVGLDVLDVDQGLAILVRTASHQLLFDTGAAWPGGSMAGRAVQPYLLQQGIRQLDKLVISHLDNDHAGGLHDVLANFMASEVLMSENMPGITSHLCKAGMHWQWDGVDFRFLHPEDAARHGKRNDKSCVLLVTAAGRHILLPGDIEQKVEHVLADSLPAVDVMVAPHHGSKTSSTERWVNKATNGIVVFSSGYLGRFGHPHPVVVQRYEAANVTVFHTALQGLVSIRVHRDGNIHAYGWRQEKGRYWQKIARIDNH